MYVVFFRAGVAGKDQIFGIKLRIIICVCLRGQRSSEILQHFRLTSFCIFIASGKTCLFYRTTPNIANVSNFCNNVRFSLVKSYINYCLSKKGTTRDECDFVLKREIDHIMY